MSDFFCSDYDAVRREAKQCGNCNERYSTTLDGPAGRGFFAADKTGLRGLQSWCRLCKALWESGPHGAWKRFAAWLREHEPRSLYSVASPHGWTEEIYVARWHEQGCKCRTCSARLDEWQVGGHRMDRINNLEPHIPANCQLLCWPCNKTKSNRTPQAFQLQINDLLERYGPGRVSWSTEYPGFERVSLPDPEPYRVRLKPWTQADLGLGGAP